LKQTNNNELKQSKEREVNKK